MLPIVKLENHVAGDTWQGIPVIGPILINGLPPASPAERVRLTLRKVPAATGAEKIFDSGLGNITIVNAATWEASIPEVPFANFTLPEGRYEGHLEFTDTAGVRLTTHEIHLSILEDKTP